MFIPDTEFDSLIKISAPIASALISSAVTYLIFSRTMAASVKAKFNEAQSSFIAAVQADLKDCRAELKDCRDDRVKLWEELEGQKREHLSLLDRLPKGV